VADPYPKLATKTEAAIYAALVDVWQAVKTSYSLADIEQIYLTNGIGGIMAILDNLDAQVANRLTPVLQSAMVESGRIVIQILPAAAITTRAWLPALSLAASQTAMQYELNLIRQISDTTRTAVRQSVVEAVATGKPPAAIARQFRSSIGITDSQQVWVSNYRRALESGDKKALDYELRDKRYDASVRAGKLSQDKIDTLVQRYEEKLIVYRSKVIARTESLRAVEIAQFESVSQGMADGHIDPELEKGWVTTKDGRERPWHYDLSNKWIPFNQYFINSHGQLLYPRDPNGAASNTIQCRCRLRYRLPSSR